jgi:Arc/MetJ-type ribon-helix-helix transcriptional regulator
MANALADRAELLRAERRLLLKADNDIEQGRQRLRNQEGLLLGLEAGGHDTEQAARLVDLMRTTLTEWERHRVLIEERVAYLEKVV